MGVWVYLYSRSNRTQKSGFARSRFFNGGRYRTRICDLYDRVGSQRVTLASTFPTAPLRTGRTPFSVSGSPKVSSLSHRNHRKRTINKNNRHHTTLRVVVCAACLSALLPSRGSSLDLLLMTMLCHSARL